MASALAMFAVSVLAIAPMPINCRNSRRSVFFMVGLLSLRQAGHPRDTLLRSDETGMISNTELEVSRIRELTGKRCHGEALVAVEALPDALQASADVLYLTAVNQRYLNRISDALETLRHLEQQDPRFSRLYQERGHCYTALGDATRAIEAFREAVNINPALPTSWHMLERLYRATGDTKSAAAA